MSNLRALAVPSIAFLLGGLVVAALTTTAQAQKSPAARPMYRIVITEADVNKYAAQGYSVKEGTGVGNYVQYLMQRYP